MCLLETAPEIVSFGILSLAKEIRLLSDAIQGPRNWESVLISAYYAVAAVMAAWLILAVLAGSKSCILRYTTAAKWQALLCLCWQLLSFFVAAAHSEVHNENGVHRTYINWPNGTSATVTVTNKNRTAISNFEPILSILVAGIVVYIALLPIYFLRRFVIWRIEVYAAALPN
ncbi:hypothetical protein MTO96_012192 [Rhipicephalus appendiculatus]